jgi:hypothetical protein
MNKYAIGGSLTLSLITGSLTNCRYGACQHGGYRLVVRVKVSLSLRKYVMADLTGVAFPYMAG